MTEPFPNVQQGDPLEEALCAELALGDSILASARPVLRHLLANDDHVLFSDEVIARVRGMITHCARQMLFALAEASQAPDRGAFADEHEAPLAALLLQDGALIAHAHALVIEAQLAERLQQRSGIDPVLSPLLQELTASSDPAQAASAMHVLAAQARFIQQQRRMEWPLSDLPGDLFHKAMLILQVQGGGEPDARAAAQTRLREQFDESQRRASQIARLIAALERKAVRALALDHAGLAIFVSALAMASDQNRELAMMALIENQFARLALSLRAAGLPDDEVEKLFLFLHPEIVLPPDFDTLRADRAAALLAASDPEGAG